MSLSAGPYGAPAKGNTVSQRKRMQAQRALELARSLSVDILAHFYQRAEIKDLANMVGSSRSILERAAESQANAVLICGVSFICERAARLRPDLPILVPRPDALCPYAQSMDEERVALIRRERPEALLVAGPKASGPIRDLCDVEMPSWPSYSFFSSLGSRPALFLPGPCPGYESFDSYHAPGRIDPLRPGGLCQVHAQVAPEHIRASREAHPGAMVLGNALCAQATRDLCDYWGDSGALWEFCGRNPSRRYIIVAEAGLSESLGQAYPEKEFFEPGLEIFCPSMKLTNIKDILRALEDYALSLGPGAALDNGVPLQGAGLGGA